MVDPKRISTTHDGSTKVKPFHIKRSNSASEEMQDGNHDMLTSAKITRDDRRCQLFVELSFGPCCWCFWISLDFAPSYGKVVGFTEFSWLDKKNLRNQHF